MDRRRFSESIPTQRCHPHKSLARFLIRSVEGIRCHCYNRVRSSRNPLGFGRSPRPNGLKRRVQASRGERRLWKRGQVAQVVERSPEKAGVGGSTPSLATMFSIS